MPSDKRGRSPESRNAHRNGRDRHEFRTVDRRHERSRGNAKDGPGADWREHGHARPEDRVSQAKEPAQPAAKLDTQANNSRLFSSSIIADAQRIVKEREASKSAQDLQALALDRESLIRERERAYAQLAAEDAENGGSNLPPPPKRKKHLPIVWPETASRLPEQEAAVPADDGAVTVAARDGTASADSREASDVGSPQSPGIVSPHEREGNVASQSTSNLQRLISFDGEAEEGAVEEESEDEYDMRPAKQSRWASLDDEDDQQAAGADTARPLASEPPAAAATLEDGEAALDTKQTVVDDPDKDLNERERLELELDVQKSGGAKPSPIPAVYTVSTDDGSSDGEEQPPSPSSRRNQQYNMLRECRNVSEFEIRRKIAEGTYGVVYRARDRHAKGQKAQVALKKIKLQQAMEGFPLTSIREIGIMLSLHHPNIVNVSEVVVGKTAAEIFMVMEWVEFDLKFVMESVKKRGGKFNIPQIKCMTRQILEGVAYLHENWVLHRDLKPSNLLYDHLGRIKICDFGMARQYSSPLRDYSPVVVTKWYRAPELFVGMTKYSEPVDVWSVGCIMGELLIGEPLFASKKDSDFDMMDEFTKLLGGVTDANWPSFNSMPHIKNKKLSPAAFKNGKKPTLRDKLPMQKSSMLFSDSQLSEAGYDLLTKLLAYDPDKRITAQEALRHKWFDEYPKECNSTSLPQFGSRDQKSVFGQHSRQHPSPLDVMGRATSRVVGFTALKA